MGTATADIVARLRLSGENFSSELRTQFGQFETMAQAAATKASGAFRSIGANILPPAEFQRLFAAGAAAADRMQASIDPLFAAQQRYNRSLQELNELQVLGFATGARYQQIHAGITRQLEEELRVNQRLGVSTGQRRIGMQQLSFQAGDVAQQLAVGTSAAIVFAQQSGQVIQALQLMGGEGNKFLRFLGSGWGVALAAAAVVLAPVIGKLFDWRTELQKATDELEENARKAELTKQAQQAYGQTLPGVAAAIRDQTEALKAQNRTMAENRQLALDAAQAHLATVQTNRASLTAEFTRLQNELRTAEQRQAEVGAGDIEGFYAQATQRAREALEAVTAQIEAANRASTAAQDAISRARIPMVMAQADARLNPEARINDRYDHLIRSAQERAVAERTVETTLADQVFQLNRQREVELQRERDRERAERRRPPSDGVSRFRSREQAIGVAGRELLQGGFNVGENVQFGGVRANHTFAQHGQFAIDVNIPGAGVEANDPEARARMDAVARSYQQRGFRVLWNGRIYEPGGDGPGPVIPARNRRGQAISPHFNHLHLEAPGSIVGRPTQSAAGSDAIRDANREQREIEARARIVQSMEQETAQAVEQARLGDIRVQGLEEEATLETQLSARRQQAAERLAQLRQGGASDEEIEAQQRISNGLQEQLSLYEDQSAAYARMLLLHRQDGEITAEEAAAERAAAAAKQQTLARAQQIGTTVEDNLQIQLSMVRAETSLNRLLDEGAELRNKQKTAARELEEEQQQILDDAKQEMIQRGEDQIRDLADLYGDLFRGRVGDIWDRFKDQGLEVIAMLAAQWTLAQLSGQQFNAGGALQGMGGNPIASLLGGLFNGGKGGAAAGGGEWWNIFAAGGQGGAGAAGGAGGLMAGLGSAMPYIGAAFAAFGLLQQFGVFSSTKRGSATLGLSGGELGAGATRGNSQDYIAASSSAMDSVGSSLQRIAETLGGTVTGAGSVSLGQRDGNWRGDATGRGITKTKKGAIDFGDDQEAAIRWAISEALRDGVIGGISDAAKRILQSGKDLEKAIAKAVMIEEIPKLLKGRLDPVGAALDELQERWDKVVAALKEGGATAEQMAEAQQLYKLELEETIARTDTASASLKEFLDSLKMGSNSPFSLRDQEASARAALQPFLDKIAAGEGIDQDAYQSAAQTFLDIERQLYGSTGPFFEAMDVVMAATSKAIDRIDSAVPIRTAVDPFVEATAANTGTIVDQLGNISTMLATLLGGGGANDNGTYNPSDFVGGGRGFTGAQLD